MKTMTRITNELRDVLVTLNTTPYPVHSDNFHPATTRALDDAGLILVDEHGFMLITNAGRVVAREHVAQKELARRKRNRWARARHRAMTDLGLTRTPHGYE